MHPALTDVMAWDRLLLSPLLNEGAETVSYSFCDAETERRGGQVMREMTDPAVL